MAHVELANVVCVVAVGVMVAGLIVRVRAVERRTRGVEEKLDRLLAHLGVEPGTEAATERGLSAAAETLRRGGGTVRAIRAYQEATGADVEAARAAVDRLATLG
jgi:hypothetical protein